MTLTAPILIAILVPAAPNARPAQTIGERPAIEHHLDQAEIEAGDVRFEEIFRQGKKIFSARFNFLDGQGRPGSRGDGVPRVPNQPEFIRTSGPDSNSCAGCHAQPEVGGAGDFVANVFVLAQTLDPVTESVNGSFSNERNTLGMMGAGPIEMLAREMSNELIALRESARQEAAQTQLPATRELIAKGVHFGSITVQPDGKIDPTQIQGVDCDLIVKPFHQKGVVVSIREFNNNATNHHHGIQSVERFGEGVDADGDGMVNEMNVGDITALTIFQAALNTPGRVMPKDRFRRAAVSSGEILFDQIGCTTCHIPSFTLNDRNFTEPNPFNQPGNLRLADVTEHYSFDMTKDGPRPRLERTPGGGAIIRPYTDLKRHNLNDADFDHFANEKVPQGKLNGFEPMSDFTGPLPPRPTAEFLTRKLWDVGNTAPYGHRGDLTTMTDAIFYHGGDARQVRDAFFALPQASQNAVIEFLRTLQVLPSDSPAVVYEDD